MNMEELQSLENEMKEKFGEELEYKPFISSLYDTNYADLLAYLDEVKDNELKYIYLKMLRARMNYESTLTKKKNIENRNAVRDSLAEEFGLTKSAITHKYKSTSKFLNQKVEENHNKITEKFIKSCYDENGELSLINIANNFDVDVLELKEAIAEYARSLTLKEYEGAMEFRFGPAADKVCNINLIVNEIHEFKDDKTLPQSISNLHINDRKQQLYHFLWSITQMVEDYRELQKSGIKIKKIHCY